MAAIISTLQAFFAGVLAMAGDVLDMITATTTGDGGATVLTNPLLLMFVLLPLIGIGVGLLARLFHMRG